VNKQAVHRLDLVTLTWSRLPDLQVPRYFHTLAFLNEELVVLGGYGNTMEVLKGDEWVIQELQTERSAHAMVIMPCAK